MNETDTLRQWHAEMTEVRDEWLAEAERMDESGKMDAMADYYRQRAAGCQAFLDEVEAMMGVKQLELIPDA